MIRTAEEYLNSLKDGREVYYEGERIYDVTSHPVLQYPIKHAYHYYTLREDPKLNYLIYYDNAFGEICRLFKLPKTTDDLLERSRIIQEVTRGSDGVFNIIQVVGSDTLFSLMIVTKKMNSAEYFNRVMDYYAYVAKNDLAIATAQTDVKGDRSKRPHEQADPRLYLRVEEVTDDGIFVSGAKAHTTQSIAANEVIFIPSRAMTEKDDDYAIAFSIPVSTKGLKFIVRPLVEIEGWPDLEDAPLSRRHVEAESLTVLDNVFVPWERVFMFKQWKFAAELVNLFTAYHRFTALSYRAVVSDLFLGSAKLMAKYNGIEDSSHVRSAITDIIMYKEIMNMAVKSAALDCLKDEDTGLVVPNPLYVNVGKLYAGAKFSDVIKHLIDIAGGYVSTLPSTKDMKNHATAKYIERYMKGVDKFSGVDRFKLLRFVRELVGGPLSGYMMGLMIHAEGSPAASAIQIYRSYDSTHAEELVSKLADVRRE